MKLLVKVPGTQTMPPTLFLSSEINVPENSGIKNYDRHN
ncbi:hypothetical protein ASZ90_008790 [hydrocarbon metagenome]|uniref:Uncharacterized protein n=1 Tax=hydrocarbon metagenome TaxID=938273 RepID=A0A0W8FKK2_9ZZZZ